MRCAARGPPSVRLRTSEARYVRDNSLEAVTMEQINSLFTNLLNIGTGVAVTVAAFFLMWGAFLYMSASGSPHQLERGKSAMFNALAGLAVVLSARAMAGVIQTALGTGR